MTEVKSTLKGQDVARSGLALLEYIKFLQAAFVAVEECRVPVIVAVHGACIGAGVDMICACDIRICDKDAWFSVKEIQIGITADLGVLQRLPKITGNQSWAREVCLTGRRFDAAEALKRGFVSEICVSRDELMSQYHQNKLYVYASDKAIAIAKRITQLSPVAVVGTKKSINYAVNHSISEGLELTAMANMSLLQSVDVQSAAVAVLDSSKGNPIFSRL